MRSELYSNYRFQVARLLTGFITVFCMIFLNITACTATKAEDIALKAYNLRLDGKVDDAKSLLEGHLSDNPDDAMANYELSRIYLYILTSQREDVKTLLENAKSHIDKAVELDPENIAYHSFAAQVAFLNAYMALQGGAENGGELIEALCAEYESILELQPDYWLASLCLAEIYCSLPEEMGGDPVKAEEYAKKLEQYDEVIGAKARALLMPEDADYVAFWNTILEKHQGDSRVLEELGKTHFKMRNGDEGVKYLRDAIKANPELAHLYLDISRYYLYSIMSDRSLIETYLPLFEIAINDFLATDPVAPLKAWATGWLGRLKSNAGNKEDGEELAKQAESIDPYYSKATAIPSADLFIPPGEIPYTHSYLFQPF